MNEQKTEKKRDSAKVLFSCWRLRLCLNPKAGGQEDIGERGKPEQQQEYDSVGVLRNRREQLKAREEQLQEKYRLTRWLVSPVLIVCFPLIEVILMVVVSHSYYLYGLMAALFLVYGITFLFGTFYLDSTLRTIRPQIEDLDFQIHLKQMSGSSDIEKRSEEQLRYNNLQLSRYYEQNLRHNNSAFWLGVFCIFIGTCVIAATFYFVLYVGKSLDAQIVTGVIGGIGAIMTNFIAAIYLMMHGSTTKNLAGFHSRLVDTHKILLANLVASRIENSETREETLKQLAINLSRQSSDPNV